ncbi:uncharacterized protein LACBIDRAFT_315044 [Laccaria bicolor S238N-H82]|uniref:Predicted protein n=1 Tax=Laccaria bicolor (strain S238N-H82 / ATCC MYA-4686) TaxID=486041 RepID=B0E551_LACBS|nr:uncharacterized protein LACBIDRAFT_315044 [Laccaria bicolor S238N-H82]EDQ98031.1 predicted protein [Laccaria bicolor S238N-H82]|eukprot:XP_001891318.1 predicted protein [Laccaria bicolor S238N-H82]
MDEGSISGTRIQSTGVHVSCRRRSTTSRWAPLRGGAGRRGFLRDKLGCDW